MSIDEIEQELGVLQLSDSFFPTGIFATSNGLEFLFKEKRMSGAPELTEIIRVIINQQLGPSDCVALVNAIDDARMKNFEKIIEMDNIVFATKAVKEIRDASVRSGVQLVKCVSEFVTDEILNRYKTSIAQNKVRGVFPVAFAICCNALSINKEKSMMMLLYGFTVGIVGAALRLGLIQHFEGQRIIHDVKPTISQTIKDYSDNSFLDMWQFSPQMDIIQMSHEKMDAKMFIT